ncbi:hypothetical protein BS78_03G111700 [Paspalum vaginatum]|nr:hypothetical protein BS78_03G111700 [Paspalum vaginatum]
MFLLGPYKLAVLSCFWLLNYVCGQSFRRNFDFIYLSFQNGTVLCTTIENLRFSKGHLVACKTIVKDFMWI